LILNKNNFQLNMNTCQFKEIFVIDKFEIENGVLELDFYLTLSH
jgi:hypothetical protein